MATLLTIWLPVGITAFAAWFLHRRRPATMAGGLQALERLIGVPAPLPAPVRLVERPRPELRLVRGGVDRSRHRREGSHAKVRG